MESRRSSSPPSMEGTQTQSKGKKESAILLELMQKFANAACDDKWKDDGTHGNASEPRTGPSTKIDPHPIKAFEEAERKMKEESVKLLKLTEKFVNASWDELSGKFKWTDDGNASEPRPGPSTRMSPPPIKASSSSEKAEWKRNEESVKLLKLTEKFANVIWDKVSEKIKWRDDGNVSEPRPVPSTRMGPPPSPSTKMYPHSPLNKASPYAQYKNGAHYEKFLEGAKLRREVPESSYETGSPKNFKFPNLGQGGMKVKAENEGLCILCRDDWKNDIILMCDCCHKFFHLGCHLPVVSEYPSAEVEWICNFETSKEKVDEQISRYPTIPNSELKPLVPANERKYLMACKFVLECYKLENNEIIRYFAAGYKAKLLSVPVHLKYIRERLANRKPAPFADEEDFILAFQTMFMQAYRFYKITGSYENEEAFNKYLETFLTELIDVYYPEYRRIFSLVYFNNWVDETKTEARKPINPYWN